MIWMQVRAHVHDGCARGPIDGSCAWQICDPDFMTHENRHRLIGEPGPATAEEARLSGLHAHGS